MNKFQSLCHAYNVDSGVSDKIKKVIDRLVIDNVGVLYYFLWCASYYLTTFYIGYIEINNCYMSKNKGRSKDCLDLLPLI